MLYITRRGSVTRDAGQDSDTSEAHPETEGFNWEDGANALSCLAILGAEARCRASLIIAVTALRQCAEFTHGALDNALLDVKAPPEYFALIHRARAIATRGDTPSLSGLKGVSR